MLNARHTRNQKFSFLPNHNQFELALAVLLGASFIPGGRREFHGEEQLGWRFNLARLI